MLQNNILPSLRPIRSIPIPIRLFCFCLPSNPNQINQYRPRIREGCDPAYAGYDPPWSPVQLRDTATAQVFANRLTRNWINWMKIIILAKHQNIYISKVFLKFKRLAERNCWYSTRCTECTIRCTIRCTSSKSLQHMGGSAVFCRRQAMHIPSASYSQRVSPGTEKGCAGSTTGEWPEWR